MNSNDLSLSTSNSNNSMNINGMSYHEIDKLTSQNANPTNSNLRFTNKIDGIKLWNTPLIPNAESGLAHVFGIDVAEKLMFNRIDFGWHMNSKDAPKYKAQVLEAQLLAWTKLVVSQKPKRNKTEFSNDVYMPLPIEVDDEFVVLSAYLDRKALTVPPNIAGLDMIEAIGTKVILPSQYLEAAVTQMAQFLDVDNQPGLIYNKIKDIAKSTRYTTKALIIAMLTYFCTEGMNSHIKFLVDSHVYDCMIGLFKNVPENVVSVDSNWNRFMEFKVEPKHISWYVSQWVDQLDNMYKKDGKEKFLKMETYRLPSGEHELHIIFEGIHKLIVNSDGVFEADRNRQLYNAVMVTQQAIDYTNGDVKKEDIIYLNSYAVLLRYLVQNAAVFAEKVPYTAKFFTKRLLNELTFVAIKDTGEIDGDRRMLEKSTAITIASEDYVRVWSTKAPNGTWNLPEYQHHSTLPFKFGNVQQFVNKVGVDRHYQKQRQSYIAPWRVDETAFVELNLARSKKHFVDGRRVALQAKHIPEAVRTPILKLICSEAYNVLASALDEAIYKDFPDLIEANYTSEQLWEYLGHELVFGLSSKLSKLVKRTIMYAAQIGRLLESENVYLKQTGQKESSVNCQAVKCIVSTFHCDAQGVAGTLQGDEGYLFNHIVPHRIERKLSLRPIPLSAKQPDSVTLDLETYLGKPTSSRVEGSWTIYSYEPGIPKSYKEQILAMPFQPKGSSSKEGIINFNLFNEYDEALVNEIWVRYVPLAGKIKQVQIWVDLTTLEHGVKGRGITKTMFSNVPANTVFNDLNPELSKDAVQAIFYKDTNKWLDTTLNLLPMVYMTAHKNAESWPEGIAIIKEIDKVAGENNWSALLDKLGVYTPLRAAFDNKFGKEALWVQHEEHQCTIEQSCIALEFNIYKNAEGWNKLDINTLPTEVLNAIPEEYVNVVAYIQGEIGEYANNKINVKIFGSDETKTNWFTAQRSRVYVGTSDCPLYMPVKAEMASVRSLIGTSPAMGGVIRNIATHDRDFAVKMLSKNFKAYNKFAGFLGMSRSSSIQPLEGEQYRTIVMNSGGRMSREAINLIRTDKVREIYKATENEGTFLLELSKLFSNINFVIITDNIVKENADDEDEVGTREQASFSMYLPIIVAQSAGAGFRTTDDLSSNVQKLFTNLLHGMDWLQVDEYGVEHDNLVTENLCNRIGGAIKSLAKTKGIAKCASFGLLGVMAKPTGLYGVPLDEVWVRKSERYDSVYRTMLRTYNLKASELDCFPVLFSRAPMTAVAKVRVRVVDYNHDMYNFVNEDGFSFNPLACYYHRGDYDGDLNYLYPGVIDGVECKVPLLTVRLLIDSIKSSTGNDQLYPGGSYYGDGFEVPTFKSVKKKRTFGADSITLNSLKPSMLDVHSTKKPSLGQLLAGSTRMLRQAVGVAHRLFITTDLYITAIEELEVVLGNQTPIDFKVMNWLQPELIQILGEIYEVPLGGFDKWAYIVFYNHIIPLINGEIEPKFAVDIIASGLATPAGKIIAPLTSLSGIMNKAGMNGSIVVHNGKDDERFEDGQIESVADDVNKAIKALIMCKSWEKKIKTIDGKEFDQWGEDKYEKFFSLAAEISLLLSKGAFLPEVEKSGAADYVNEAFEPYSREELTAMGYEYFDELGDAEDDTIDEQNNVSLQRKMLNAYIKGAQALNIDSERAISTCTVFGPIEYYRKTVCQALLGDTVYIDTTYFESKQKIQQVQIATQPEVINETTEIEEENLDAVSIFNTFIDNLDI